MVWLYPASVFLICKVGITNPGRLLGRYWYLALYLAHKGLKKTFSFSRIVIFISYEGARDLMRN